MPFVVTNINPAGSRTQTPVGSTQASPTGSPLASPGHQQAQAQQYMQQYSQQQLAAYQLHYAQQIQRQYQAQVQAAQVQAQAQAAQAAQQQQFTYTDSSTMQYAAGFLNANREYVQAPRPTTSSVTAGDATSSAEVSPQQSPTMGEGMQAVNNNAMVPMDAAAAAALYARQQHAQNSNSLGVVDM